MPSRKDHIPDRTIANGVVVPGSLQINEECLAEHRARLPAGGIPFTDEDAAAMFPGDDGGRPVHDGPALVAQPLALDGHSREGKQAKRRQSAAAQVAPPGDHKPNVAPGNPSEA